MPWTYMLECADGSFYVGSTWDLERRVSEHNLGTGAAYTRRPGRRPVTLVWAADFDRIEDAYRYEKQIQGWRREKRIALRDGRWEDLPELASRGWRPGPGSPFPDNPRHREDAAGRGPDRGQVGREGSAGFETGASAPSSTNGEPGR